MKKIILLSALSMLYAAAHSQSWNLTGNAGTTVSANFLGTTDNTALRFRTNNVNRMSITSAGKVGIGITSPAWKLDVKGGSINTDADYRIGGNKMLWAIGTGNSFGGISSGFFNDPSMGGVNNTAFGNLALYSNTWGQDNTALGFTALYSVNGGHHNTAIGAGTMYSSTSGTLNTAIGAYSMNGSTSGSQNTAVGAMSLYNNTSGGNVALGYQSMYNNVKGGDNVSIGFQAMYSNTTASSNVAVGRNALLWQSYSNGNTYWVSGNVAVGNDALNSNQPTSNATGVYNTATGTSALYSNTFGFNNTANGASALYLNTSGTFNTGIGYGALYSNTVSNRNTAVGKNAGNLYDNASFNTFIGSFCDANGASYTNSSAVGDLSIITASNQVRLGDMGITSIGGYAGWTNLSDSRFKTNIRENVPGMEFINKLRPVTYTFDVHGANKFIGVKEDGKEKIYDAKSRIQYTGFIAQEVERAAAELGFDFSGVDKPKNERDLYGLRYAEFVVPLVKAVQELDEKCRKSEVRNQKLEEENEGLKNDIAEIKEKLGLQATSSGLLPSASGVIEQNNPNPFSERTTINYLLGNDAASPFIVIRNLDGVVTKRIMLEKTNAGSIIIEGSQLSQGTYTYTLEVNGKSVDTKLMVITK
jgi:hypothetical protein